MKSLSTLIAAALVAAAPFAFAADKLAHKDAKDLAKMSHDCKDPDVKAAVDEALPEVKEHLQQAEQLAPTKNARRKS